MIGPSDTFVSLALPADAFPSKQYTVPADMHDLSHQASHCQHMCIFPWFRLFICSVYADGCIMHPLASLALPANCRPCKWCAAYGNNSATYLCRAWHCRPMDVLLSEVLFIRDAVGLVDSCLYGLACLALPANGCPFHLCAVCARLLNLLCTAWPCRPMDAFALYTLFMLF